MIEKKVSFSYQEFDALEECSVEVQELFHQAEEAKKRAYAPYSKFQVGAALLLDNGKVITGNNQENAAYPSGLCAERVAIFAAKASYPNAHVKALVIVTSAKNIKEPVSPCGSCRQVLVEYEQLQKENYPVYLQSEKGKIIALNSAESLLPFSFHSDMLHA